MKKQVIFIHGGEAFSDYDDFLKRLKEGPIHDPVGSSPKRWKNGLSEGLGENYEVFLPSMPNQQNSKYTEWKIWFERYFEFLRDDVILIGHSQGGWFLAKYLSENTIPIKVRALFLVAAPIEPGDFAAEGSEDGGDFAFDIKKLTKLASQVGNIFIYHSEDDPVVPFAHAGMYKKALPKATLITFKNKGHFLMEELPELIEHIQKM